MDIKNVNLAFSCPEKLKQTPSENFFCDKCSRELIDFRNKTIEDLQYEIDKSVKPLCGAFKRSQLSDQFIRYALSTMIVTSSLTISALGQESAKPDSLSKILEKMDKDDEEEVIFGMVIETQPEPVGGYNQFFKKLTGEIKYPPALNIKGKTFVEFSIDTLGRMIEIKVIKGFHEDADREAVRALTSLNYPFKPGRLRNKPVKTRMVIPVLFNPENAVNK